MSVNGDSKRRTRRNGSAAAAVALLVAWAISGCTQSQPAQPAPAQPSVTPASAASTTPTPTPTADAPLSCDDLVPKAQIVQALAAGQPSDDWVVLQRGTVDGVVTGDFITGVKALEGAGGISCSWQAGPPNSETGEAVLTVSILPDAADQWTAALYGDSPTDQRRTFAGVSAAATCGDPGCGATAAVGSSWVRVDLITGSREGGESAFAKESDDEVFAGLKPAVETVFRTVQGASAAELRFPSRLPTDGKADCTSWLAKADLASALDVKGTSIDTGYPPDPKLDSLFAAAELRLGDSVCIVVDPQYDNAPELASVTVAPEQSWAVDDIATHEAQRGDLHETQLEGLTSGERALSNCGSSGNACTVVFTIGTTALQVESDGGHTKPVAEAIIALAR